MLVQTSCFDALETKLAIDLRSTDNMLITENYHDVKTKEGNTLRIFVFSPR